MLSEMSNSSTSKRHSTYHLAVIWDKTDLWRFGFGVKGKGARPCKAWGMAKIHNVFSPVYFSEQSKSPPSPAAMKFAYPSANCPRHLSVVTDLPRGMGGTLPLALGHKSISQPKPLSPLSTQPSELTLTLGVFVDLFTDCFPLGLGLRCHVKQVFPPGARYQGGGKVASGRRRG